MSDPIDRIVKGAPPPDVSPEQVAANAKATSSHINPHSITAPQPPPPPSTTGLGAGADPRDALPSSPPQIYLNLLILESSLRLQYLSLRARLRLHMLLLAILIAWDVAFSYLLFFRPREDGLGVGGSVYWMVDSTVRLFWCGGLVTSCLFVGTGMYERGVRWPRKFISTTNRGLRGFNLKVVVIKGSFFSELRSWIGMLDMLGWLQEERINFQVVPKDIDAGTTKEHWNQHASRHGLLEEDLAPGGDVLRVLLLPKPFSPDFREGWDTYRMEYWERENSRRTSLRAVVRAREREVARRDGGWLWWTGWRGFRNMRIFSSRKTRRQLDLERLALKDRPRHKRRESVMKDSPAHSRQSSSSSISRTPTPDLELKGLKKTADGQRSRRGSSTRRPRKQGSTSEKSRLSATETLFQHSPDFAMSKRDSSFIDDGERKRDSAGVAVYTNEMKMEPADL